MHHHFTHHFICIVTLHITAFRVCWSVTFTMTVEIGRMNMAVVCLILYTIIYASSLYSSSSSMNINAFSSLVHMFIILIILSYRVFIKSFSLVESIKSYITSFTDKITINITFHSQIYATPFYPELESSHFVFLYTFSSVVSGSIWAELVSGHQRGFWLFSDPRRVLFWPVLRLVVCIYGQTLWGVELR